MMKEVISNDNATMLRNEGSRGLMLVRLSLIKLLRLILVTDCPLQILLNEELFQVVSIPWTG